MRLIIGFMDEAYHRIHRCDIFWDSWMWLIMGFMDEAYYRVHR